MRNKLITLLAFLLVLPCSALAFPLNKYFQQGVVVVNHSSNTILVTDPATADVNKDPLSPGYRLTVKYASDQFTVASGQTFNHTVNIHSQDDNKLICTVTSNLYISENVVESKRPTTTDASKCETSTYFFSSGGHMIYGFLIDVYS